MVKDNRKITTKYGTASPGDSKYDEKRKILGFFKIFKKLPKGYKIETALWLKKRVARGLSAQRGPNWSLKSGLRIQKADTGM